MSSFRLSALAAYAEHRVIGYHNALPWHLPADLKRFKTLTMGKPIIMGRKTHLSIGKALPGRLNLVLSSDSNFHAPNCLVFSNLNDAIQHAKTQSEEAFIIGGAALYQHALPFIHRLYLTEIHETFKGDAFFPEINLDEWAEQSREIHQPDAQNPHAYTYITLERLLPT